MILETIETLNEFENMKENLHVVFSQSQEKLEFIDKIYDQELCGRDGNSQKVIIACSSKHSNIYTVLFLGQNGICLALVHDDKDPDTNRLEEISKSDSISINRKYLGDEGCSPYNPDNLSSTRLVLCHRYSTDDLKTDTEAEGFRLDCNDVMLLHNMILKDIERRGEI